MNNPVKLIDILSAQTAAENLDCEHCAGSGELFAPSPECGYDILQCPHCLGCGYNQLGLILHGILKPPAEGYGPVDLRDALKALTRPVPVKDSAIREGRITPMRPLPPVIDPEKAMPNPKTWGERLRLLQVRLKK